MARSKKSSPKPAQEPSLTQEVAKEVSELRVQAGQLFAGKEYAKAIELYDKAVKLLPEGAPERADFLSNKAACYYQQKKFKDAAKECTSALQLVPTSSKALLRRAKAFEQQGLYKQALSDFQAVNKSDSATEDSREAEKRLKEVMAGKRAAGGAAASTGGGASALANGAARATVGNRANARSSTPFYFTAKCTLGEEVKLVHMMPSVSYADLHAVLREKFAGAGPFIIKFVDKEGDLVTITNKRDIHTALGEVLAAYQRDAAHGPKMGQPQFPPIKLQLVPVASEADVPRPPEDEELQRQAQLLAAAQRLAALQKKEAIEAQATAAQQQTGGGQQQQQQEVYEIDDWLIDFANLFREMTGVDPDKHIEFHNEGWESCTKAMDAALQSDKALPLFDKAAERFKDVTCTGLYNWGNVYICTAHKWLDEAATKGEPLSGVVDSVNAEFDKAEQRYSQALEFKSDFFDGLTGMGQLDFERAKVRAGLLVKPTRAPPVEENMDTKKQEEMQKAAAAAAADILSAAMQRVTPEDVQAAVPLMQRASDWFKKAIACAPDAKATVVVDSTAAASADKPAEGVSADGAAGAAAAGTTGDAPKKDAAAATAAAEQPETSKGADAEMSMQAQARIMYGNILYEWSQLLAAVGQEWRPTLDEAVQHFRDAGCAETDVRNALRNHTQVDKLDLGPEPEVPAAVAAPAAAAAAPADAAAAEQGKEEHKQKAEAKGLPSLERKKKKESS